MMHSEEFNYAIIFLSKKFYTLPKKCFIRTEYFSSATNIIHIKTRSQTIAFHKNDVLELH